MRKFLFGMFLAIAGLYSCQTNYYTYNTGTFFSEKEVRLYFDTLLTKIPENYSVKPTVYHRIIRNDSIINFLSFNASPSDSSGIKNKFIVTFKQDSLFLLLDKKLPEFIMKDLNGNDFSSSQLMGKPALLNYWSIYCSPCVVEIPELNGLKEKYGDKMNFIALTEMPCSDDTLSKFLERHPYNFNILQDFGGVRKTLKIGPVPRNIFIDKDGYIRYIQGNFPYSAYDPQTGIKKYDDNNYFVKIIEELIKNSSLQYLSSNRGFAVPGTK